MTFLSTLFGINTGQSQNITVLTPAEYKTAIAQPKVQLVDVRTPNEFKSGHIKNAVNIDFFNQAQFKNSIGKFDKNQPIYLYCRSGNRSKSAASLLSKMGFEQIYDLKGGYLNWN